MQYTRRSVLAGMAAGLAAPYALAQSDYPNRAVRIVVPYAAGGGTDVLVRVVTKAMVQHLGQPIVVDNKPGAGTAIGASDVARSAPDGYHFLWGDNATFALNPFLYKKLPYAPLTDFAPVTLTLQGALVLVVSSSLGVNTLQEFMALAKTKPGSLSYASAGNGTPHHMAMEALKLKAGLDLQHVPYKGEGPGMQDLLGGAVQVMFVGATLAQQYSEAGRLKLLATAGSQRNEVFPQLQTVAEQGVAGFDSTYWHALVAPAKTPAAVIAKVRAAYDKARTDADVQAYLKKAGGVALSLSTPDELQQYLQKQHQGASALIKAINLKID
jgi:tripartite-type tricarboxylate transporter receptor subunit TctC